jgi:hypothetical protein
MPDLQTEIFKKVLPNMNNLNNLKFDDTPGEEPEVVYSAGMQTPNASKALWEYVKANPNQLLVDIVKSFTSLDKAGISARLVQMRHRGNIIATASNMGLRYKVAHDTYRAMTYAESLAKAHAAKAAAKAAKAAAKAAKKTPAPKTVTKKAPVDKTEVTPSLNVTSLLDTMSIVQARELYDQLKKIFGG